MRAREGGFTLVELMIYMVIGGIVIGAAYKAMNTQSRAYGKEREVLDVRETERSAVALLAWDLRHAAAGGGRLAAVTSTSITLRSVKGSGIVCSKHGTMPRIALWGTAGNFQATSADSILVHRIGRDSAWRVLKVTQTSTTGALGLNACDWPGSRSPDIVLEVSLNSRQDTLTWRAIFVGAPVRSFRVTQYSPYVLNSRWWLGRSVAGGAYEQLTGPLLPSAAGGVRFAYYDTLGAVTVNPGAVGTVGVTLRAQSFKQAALAGAPNYQQDSLSTRVALRIR